MIKFACHVDTFLLFLIEIDEKVLDIRLKRFL